MSGDTGAPPLVELAGIAYTRGGARILRDCSLRVTPGEIAYIAGANGSGKSSLLRILGGYAWPDPGVGARRFAFDGRPAISPLLARPHIRLASPETQERFLRLRIPATIEEYVASGVADTDYPPTLDVIGADARAARDAALDLAGLSAVAGRRIVDASHGTVRRAVLARALAARPALLLIDEALDGLDAAAYARVSDELRRRVREEKLALVFTAHQPYDELMRAARRYVLEDGALRECAPSPRARVSASVPARPVPIAAPRVEDAERAALVELRDVAVRFDERVVLRDVSLAVRRGMHFAITGENGAGKSTLAGVLQGSTPIAAGRARRLGPRRLPLYELRRRIVLLSDALELRADYPYTVTELLTSAILPWRPPHEPHTAAERAEVARTLAAFALEEVAGRDIRTLSFGQRRFALIARALMQDPEIVILDETFDGLDDDRRAVLEAELRHRAAAGCTLVVVSHRPALIPSFVTARARVEAGCVSVSPGLSLERGSERSPARP